MRPIATSSISFITTPILKTKRKRKTVFLKLDLVFKR